MQYVSAEWLQATESCPPLPGCGRKIGYCEKGLDLSGRLYYRRACLRKARFSATHVGSSSQTPHVEEIERHEREINSVPR
jgi:hypothetical protein